MGKKQEFINYINSKIENFDDMPDGARNYWEALVNNTSEKDKPKFTDNGKLILKFMQDNDFSGKSKDIAEGLFISARGVSGAMRKLVNDGYVEKLGSDPAVYSLTEIGKNIEID